MLPQFILRLSLYNSIVISMALWLSSCQTTPAPPPECTLPQTTGVKQAFTHTRKELSRSECHFRFDAYFDRLLDTAAGDPNPQHSEHFSEFLIWANSQDIITRRNAEEYYNRYFNAKFVSLPNEYSNCAYTCRMKDEIVHNMKEELRQKDKGLLKIMANKRAYARANSLHDSILTVLEATCTACATSR
ncbi:conserved hypothetical protein [Nitrosococcus halophilus Nc 4]|uniref:Uncharacterized protein n=2 Tax=Nitrosococcus halophilus TaxID=133539 RepID=D5C1N7_NITHN|nr:conserved hypothetical protein [Nitrosococcus halophilus Nc 4]